MDLYPKEFIAAIGYPESAVDPFKHAFRAAWGETHTLVPEAKEMLDILQAKGYRLFKGNISNVSLIAYDPKDFEMLKRVVTPERVKEHFKGIVKGEVVRYELPNICALNFVMYAALGGGVTRSLSVDMHGKSLSSYLLDMEI